MRPEDFVSINPDGEIPTPKPSPQTKYSQPLAASTSGGLDGVVIRAGFVGKGAYKRVGFVFVNAAGKVEEVEATKQNEAQTKPRGFFQSLARLYAGGPHP